MNCTNDNETYLNIKTDRKKRKTDFLKEIIKNNILRRLPLNIVQKKQNFAEGKKK